MNSKHFVKCSSISRVTGYALVVLVLGVFPMPGYGEWPGIRMTRFLGTGDPAPGIPGGVVTFIEKPCMSGAGALIYGGATAPGGGGFCLWFGWPGQMELVARENGPAPDMPEGVIIDEILLAERVGESGLIAFSARLSGPGIGGSNSLVVFAGHAGDIRVILQSGDPLPVSPNGVVPSVSTLIEPYVSEDDVIACRILAPEGDYLLVGTTRGLEPVLWTGMQAPNLAEGVLISDALGSPRVGSNGFFGISAKLTGVGVDDSNDQAIILRDKGELTTFLKSGDPFPAVSPDARISNLVNIDSVNVHGDFCARLSLEGTGIDESNNQIIYSGNVSSISIIAREGDPVPTYPEGAFYDSFSSLRINDFGQVMVRVTAGPEEDIPPSLNRVIMHGAVGQFMPFIVEGMPIPFTGDTVIIDGQTSDTMHKNGEVLFVANLFPPSAFWTSGTTVMYSPDNGQTWYTVLRHGDIIDGATIIKADYHRITSGNDGIPCSFNDNGQLGVRLFDIERESATYLIELEATFDHDQDGDVDLVDFAGFQVCYTGNTRTVGASPSCTTAFDNDLDGDVDLADFAAFQLQFTGPG